MRKIGIIPNTYKDPDFSFTKEIVSWAIENDCQPFLTTETSKLSDLSNYGVPIKELYSLVDFLVVIGGDGTVLRVAKNAAVNKIPILGINKGTLGYLTDIDEEECFNALSKVLAGEYVLEKRMMLEASYSGDTENDSLIALNDITLTRGFFGNIISLELTINDEFIDIYKGDGLIVSTPTGSTAYNLSAGGPILKPDSKMLAITPICPHMLHARSFVVSSKDTVSIRVVNKKSVEVLMSLDGQNITPLNDDDKVFIKASAYYTTIIKTNTLGFYDILRKKIVGE